MRTRILVATLVAIAVAAGAGNVSAQARLFAKPGPCDRACLIAVAKTYLGALAAHDPAKAPLAPNLKFVENSEPKKAGEGLWQTAGSVPSDFALYVPDPVSEQIGFLGMLTEGDKPLQLGLRLKVEGGKITEAEHLVVRSFFNEGVLANLKTPRPGLLATVPQNERLSRELMLVIGMTYYDALEQSDGSASPFADDCERHENGLITAGPGGGAAGPGGQPRQGCAVQLDSRAMSYIDSIDLRRVWIADPETGLAFGLSQFRHSMTNKEITVIGPNGERSQRAMAFNPFDLPAAHIFKIRGGKIHEIEALGFMLPYMSRNGWSDFLR
ncbi:MAG TPA: hypothetical protein VE907_16580 [Gammaproteobacteria bacterium]|nr:hypothetical protein [Gammaproteobacteria bacterium]